MGFIVDTPSLLIRTENESLSVVYIGQLMWFARASIMAGLAGIGSYCNPDNYIHDKYGTG
jgi:hydrogenase maturation factor HypE